MRSKIIGASVIISLTLFTIATTFTNPNQFLFKNIGFHSLSKPAQKQVDCLAENIYFEAAHEPEDGKVAVAMVTLNRLMTGNYGNDICEVVKQKTGGVCQFSWYCMPAIVNKRLTVKSTPLYNDIRDLAVDVVLNYENMKDITKGATYYHADYVSPNWGLPKTTQIGRHIFYKKKTDTHIKKEINI